MSLAGLGAHADGIRLLSAGKAERQRIRVDLQIKFWNELLDRYLGEATRGSGEAAAAAARIEGSNLALDDAVAIALAAKRPS